ncbi:MAG: B12-binding domain-containing radical SAM protein [Acidobacteria bacterium]|nr:B12-binding domain-containing radical SAM protein [Acidobacteriota bacterium]
MPNALLVYPETPPSYWGANFALDLLGIKAAFPPLGLLTVAAMFPPDYDLRVVNMNVTPLEESDLEWADLVFTSTMIVQGESLQTVIGRCNRAGVPVVAGGPYPTSFHDEIQGVDHFVLDEVEETFGDFMRDLESGRANAIYREPRKPDVMRTPVPRFDLIDMKNYHSMCVQFSRGCPFDCEFCDITKLYGRVARTKSPDQMVDEFEALYRLGWRGRLFLVDDNFIGNKRAAMKLLRVIAEWQQARGYPFSLFTEASMNLARMDELMDVMVEAGFNSVFVGIETPNPKALLKMKKPQNVDKRDKNYLLNSVRTIHRKGMQVMGGFILGLDEDDEDVFDLQIEFIQEAGIPMALIGLLSALKGTDLYRRLQSENRLLEVSIGTTSTALNFVPEMDPEVLIEGYRRVTASVYDPTLENYFERCLTFFEHLKPVPHLHKPQSKIALYANMMGLRRQLSAKQVPAYMRFITHVSKDHPRMLPEAIRLAALGYHFDKVTRQQMAIHDFKVFLEAEAEIFRKNSSSSVQEVEELGARRQQLFMRAQARNQLIPEDFRYHGDGIESALESFRSSVNAQAEHFTRSAAV